MEAHARVGERAESEPTHAITAIAEAAASTELKKLAWLAFLRGQSSRNLARVIEHNRQDVVTLMRLGDHLGGNAAKCVT